MRESFAPFKLLESINVMQLWERPSKDTSKRDKQGIISDTNNIYAGRTKCESQDVTRQDTNAYVWFPMFIDLRNIQREAHTTLSLLLRVHLYTYIHTCIHTYIHTHRHTYICTYIPIHACIHTHTVTYRHIPSHTCIHTFTTAHIKICIYIYVYLYTYHTM